MSANFKAWSSGRSFKHSHLVFSRIMIYDPIISLNNLPVSIRLTCDILSLAFVLSISSLLSTHWPCNTVTLRPAHNDMNDFTARVYTPSRRENAPRTDGILQQSFLSADNKRARSPPTRTSTSNNRPSPNSQMRSSLSRIRGSSSTKRQHKQEHPATSDDKLRNNIRSFNHYFLELARLESLTAAGSTQLAFNRHYVFLFEECAKSKRAFISTLAPS
ncbi:uncharacterized protein LY89DRAFT_459632 [Mollisia scopiformis]|uniref:Uncharacterized protein n=1 Tax=Mollisia scopiformis TaxID=149040 RepID=A0A194XHQ8_MOLSC|nr:uncharacterized protein LY89DRAFT_459632 [Mollisia scopiformis]KUJ19750.1 hypothetical protein LY89DRAFT_459632 [Mollisia scopiformis]